MTIQFLEDIHKYQVIEDPTITLNSVSKLIDMVKIPFDTEKWAAKKAKERGITVEEIKKEWDDIKKESLVKGTKYHKEYEERLLQNKKVHPANYIGDIKCSHDLLTLPKGVHPELMLYNIRYGIAGTADIVEIHEDNSFDLMDHKGFPLDTEVPTKTGFKFIKNIDVGDEIFDSVGNLTKVTAKSKIHYNPCYEITFDTNEKIICDEDHRWVVLEKISPFRNEKKEKIITTKEIFDYYSNSKPKLCIKTTCINLEDIHLPIDPYVLGCWLGDGTSEAGAITNMNPKMWNEIAKRGYDIGQDLSKGGSGKTETKTLYGLRKELNRLNLLRNKHLPDIYMKGSYKQRLDLLRGLMDTDGSFNRTRKRCVMNTTKKWQADAISNIVFSLGGKATIMKIGISGFGKKNIPGYCVVFTMKENPFLTRNEDYAEIMKNVNFYKAQHRYIKSIVKVDTVPTICIAVDSPLHTYLVTRNYLPTHNTNKKLEFTGFKKFDPIFKDRTAVKMKPPLQHLDDCNGMHYTIQLSVYAWMLEQFGYKCNSLTIYHVIFDDNNEPCNIIDYPIEYLKKEVTNLLNWYKTKK